MVIITMINSIGGKHNHHHFITNIMSFILAAIPIYFSITIISIFIITFIINSICVDVLIKLWLFVTLFILGWYTDAINHIGR